MELINGDIYEGEFKQGKRHGSGTLTKGGSRSYTYKGEWKNDCRDGYGEIQFDDNARFQGQWEKGRLKNGVYMFQDGTEYSGEFSLKTSELEGQGIMTLDNEVISGEWKDSKLNGYGMRKTTTGDVYKGMWLDGKL